MAAEIQDLSRDSFPELVEQSDKPVLIDFWGPQCRPCLALSPTFGELAETHDDLRFLQTAAPSNRMLCADLGVLGLPTFLCMVNGREVSRLTGEISATQLRDWVEERSRQAKGDN